MAAASASHPPPPLLCLRVLCFLLLQFYPFAAAATTRTNGKIASLILPLKTQQVAAGSLPRLGRPPNKLYFHHNISLTVPLTVGSPPQNVSMVLDTGSELSWLRCATSKGAAAQPAAPSFRPLASSSYVAIPCASATCRDRTRDLASPAFCNPANKLCGVSLSYADGSAADGDLASDVFRVGQSLPPLRALFSCVGSPVSSSGEDAVTAGILGMNRGSLSPSPSPSSSRTTPAPARPWSTPAASSPSSSAPPTPSSRTSSCARPGGPWPSSASPSSPSRAPSTPASGSPRRGRRLPRLPPRCRPWS